MERTLLSGDRYQHRFSRRNPVSVSSSPGCLASVVSVWDIHQCNTAWSGLLNETSFFSLQVQRPLRVDALDALIREPGRSLNLRIMRQRFNVYVDLLLRAVYSIAIYCCPF